MSRRRRSPIPLPQYTADGRLICRMCDNLVPKGQRVYCSLHCKRDYLIRRYPEFAARLFREWFGTTCAGCGQDESALQKAWIMADVILNAAGCPEYLTPFKPFALHHIQPVADGGGECGLDNYQLVCSRCHGQVTGQFNRERAARRREQGPWKATQRERDGYRLPVGGTT